MELNICWYRWKIKRCLVDFHNANMPINSTFISKQILWPIIKSVILISGVNDIDSLHMKWCNLKNIGNWPFSPAHTSSHKTSNILQTVADMTKWKHTYIENIYYYISEDNIWCTDWKGALVWLLSHPLPQNLIIFHSMRHMILFTILQISEIYQPFLLSVQYLVLLMIWKYHLMAVLCYHTFTRTNLGKYVSKKCDKNASVLFVLIGEKVIKLHFWKSTPGFPWSIGIQLTENRVALCPSRRDLFLKFASRSRTNMSPVVSNVPASGQASLDARTSACAVRTKCGFRKCIYTHINWEIWMKFSINSFQFNFTYWWCRYLLWNRFHVHECYWTLVHEMAWFRQATNQS